ncbi:MAG: D-alanyl-D-alanine carboxypeptidase/D-alanyl-D-alanine-endopeptidase [Burkholderiaceae bacterium]|nr:D-alanyl-D-alanine carboxypeptidase/D-alanyl-D-alanine-endopeptidase [Burkholderiaceae bacterium]
MKWIFWPLCLFVLNGLSTAAQAGALPPAVARALAHASVPQHAASFVVRSLEGDAPARLSHRADVAMNPASVMKLVTTFSALDMLGPDFTWKTSFYTDGSLGKGVLNGDLIIRGGGDPKWVLERIEDNFKTLQIMGVQRITGDIILDNSVFELSQRGSGDFDGEPLSPYNSTPDGLLVNFKAMLLTFTPDTQNQTVHIKSEPPIAGVTIDSTVAMGQGACGDWHSELAADFSDPNRIHFAGRYSERCGERVWPVAYSDPASFATRVVKAMYGASGGVLQGQVRIGHMPATAVLLWHAPSLPLSQIIADVNKYSNNVMAQQVFLSLSAQKSGENPDNTAQGSFARSRDIVKRWWQRHFGHRLTASGRRTEDRKNHPIQAPALENGSGLSRSERVSAQSLTELLRTAAAHPAGPVFADSLSIAGVDGTAVNMAQRGIIQQAIGKAQLKTGSLRDVVAVAGYAMGKSGQRYSVVGIINHPNAHLARPALDALVEWTVVEN